MDHLESMGEHTCGEVGILTSSSSGDHHSTFQQAKLTKGSHGGKAAKFDRSGCMGLAVAILVHELPVESPRDMQEYLVGRGFSRKLFVWAAITKYHAQDGL